MQTWLASNLWLVSSACIMPSVSIPSASERPSVLSFLQPVAPFLEALSSVSYLNNDWRPITLRHLSFTTHFFYPYQLPPTPYFCRFLYWRIMEYISVMCFSFLERAGKLLMWNSLSCRAFNALDTWRVPIGCASDEGVTSSSAPFHFVYNGGPPPHFPYFIFADLWERDRRPELRQFVL